MDETKAKAVYSKNEKILRIVCIVAIALSFIIGILLFPVGKVGGGITVLCTSAVAVFLLSGFFVKKYKGWFANKQNKRAIYALLYALILVLSLLTAFIASYYSSYDKYEMETLAREEAVKAVQTNANGEIEARLFDFFESGDSYYFSYEIDFSVIESSGAVIRKSIVSYVKVNQYTSEVSFIDFYQCELARSYASK